MSRAAADAWIDQNLDSIANRVDARRDALDAIRWPQVLRTHTDANIPADGGGVAPDNLNAVTTDNGDGWSRLNLTIGGPWRAALEINNYGDSIGQGCEYVGYVREAGVLYRRVFKVEGHQTDRLSGWVDTGITAPQPFVAQAWSATKRLASATGRAFSRIWRT